ncbi:MAG: C39 family peptidase [Deltaproteobacteria bacterium]|nr:C39 family peptidase [Deltaproteobacteria bacterium]
MKKFLTLDILPQPDDTTCGPTCLHALYRYFGDEIPLQDVIAEVQSLKGGGTLGVMLANHALRRGYRASIYTYNLMIFDPTWFLPEADIQRKLAKRLEVIHDAKQKKAIRAYQSFLINGGKIHFVDLTRNLLRRFLKSGRPILTGLNSTFLYRAPRVDEASMKNDDIGGEVVGHFVVLSGYDQMNKTVHVSDPYARNPFANQSYELPIDRVIGAILLGVMTYDANFLIIDPGNNEPRHNRKAVSV